MSTKVKKSGHIEIKDHKVLFVYHELKKPEESGWFDNLQAEIDYPKLLKEYEASKRSIKVENALITPNMLEKHPGKCCIIIDEYTVKNAEHNQPCRAEITEGKATITKIT